MHIKITDFMGASNVIANQYQSQWDQLEQTLLAMPLHLKASDQYGRQGTPIFDPVGTNEYIASVLSQLGWGGGLVIPPAFDFLGTDVDFVKHGLLVEVQFSNYPFLLNNTIRTELFFRDGTIFHGAPTGAAVIVTKSGMFPASQSTLYYEQAVSQLTALARYNIFTVPIRLVGLFEQAGPVSVTWTDYVAPRYSRTVLARVTKSVDISINATGKCRIT